MLSSLTSTEFETDSPWLVDATYARLPAPVSMPQTDAEALGLQTLLLYGLGDLNSGLYTDTARALSTVPSPQLHTSNAAHCPVAPTHARLCFQVKAQAAREQ